MGLNVLSIRRKVDKAIRTAPCIVDIYRDTFVDNGVGGKKKVPATKPLYKEVVGLLDNSGHSSLSIIVGNNGAQYNKDNGCVYYVAYVDGVEFKQGDYFKISSTKYTITNAVDILNLHIYWELNIRTENDG